MSSISFDSDDDVCLLSTADLTGTSNKSSSSSILYTPEQLKQFLLKKDQKFRLENNDSTKTLASWRRSFGYLTVISEKFDLNT